MSEIEYNLLLEKINALDGRLGRLEKKVYVSGANLFMLILILVENFVNH